MRAGARNAEKSKAAAFDWVGIEQSLDARGNAVLSRLLNAKQCGEIATRYAEEKGYRAQIVMARYGFGRGEYKYFSYPLPSLLDQLRHTLYPHLVPIAKSLESATRYRSAVPGRTRSFSCTMSSGWPDEADAADPRIRSR